MQIWILTASTSQLQHSRARVGTLWSGAYGTKVGDVLDTLIACRGPKSMMIGVGIEPTIFSEIQLLMQVVKETS